MFFRFSFENFSPFSSISSSSRAKLVPEIELNDRAQSWFPIVEASDCNNVTKTKVRIYSSPHFRYMFASSLQPPPMDLSSLSKFTHWVFSFSSLLKLCRACCLKLESFKTLQNPSKRFRVHVLKRWALKRSIWKVQIEWKTVSIWNTRRFPKSSNVLRTFGCQESTSPNRL